MRCIDCKKELREQQSLWDRTRLFLFHFFHEDIQDVKEEQFTKGFGDGWSQGFDAYKQRHPFHEQSSDDIIKKIKQWEK